MPRAVLDKVSNQCRNKKTGDGAERKRQSLTCCRDSEQKWRERDCARHAAQTAREKQATLQQKSTHECKRMASETPGERETRLH